MEVADVTEVVDEAAAAAATAAALSCSLLSLFS